MQLFMNRLGTSKWMATGLFVLLASAFAAGTHYAISRGNGGGNYNLRAFGAVGDGVADDTAALQAAIDKAARYRRKLVVPAGTYKVSTGSQVIAESGVVHAALFLRANLRIAGEPGATIKLAGGQSSDTAPKSLAMFFTNQVLRNISLHGLILDMNAAENSLSPARPATFNRYNQSHLLVSGTLGGIAARIDRVHIADCTFSNTAGACCIVMGQSNVPGTKLGRDWIVERCLFVNNGSDTDDHTSIFAWADNVRCEGNTFVTDRMFGTQGETGGRVAYEVHGSDHIFANNTVLNYYRGLWVASNYSTTARNARIEGNTFRTLAYGVDVFRDRRTLTPISGILIRRNTFIFDDSFFAGAPTQKAAVQIACEYAVSNFTITQNIAFKTGTEIASAFLVVAPQKNPGQQFSHLACSDNVAEGFSTGAFIRTNSINGLGVVTVERNRWSNLAPAGIATFSIGVFSDSPSPIKSLLISNNICMDSRSVSRSDYGVYLTGHLTSLFVTGQVYQGMAKDNYVEAKLVVHERRENQRGG